MHDQRIVRRLKRRDSPHTTDLPPASLALRLLVRDGATSVAAEEPVARSIR
jgi:hypothetical protein